MGHDPHGGHEPHGSLLERGHGLERVGNHRFILSLPSEDDWVY